MSIVLKDICKTFGDKTVLDSFTYSFPQGEITCIMGTSGCGKTTLLNILLGLTNADSGEISGIGGLRKSAVFQEDRLCENISAAANLRLINPALSKKDAEIMLCELGLENGLGQPVRELSGGMKRRTAILRALCAEYDLLLADEPFKGLDEATKLTVMKYFKEKTTGKTVILVTHDESEAEFFGGNTLIM